jgi:oligosaccharide repeat unit polymerase
MIVYHFLTFSYFLCCLILISRMRFSLTLAVLVYTGPVLSVILHLYLPNKFMMGGGRAILQTPENTEKLLFIALLGILGLSAAYIKPSRLQYRLPGLKLNLSYFEIICWSLVALLLLLYIMPTAKIFQEGYHYSLAAQQELPGLKVGRNIAHSILAVIFVSMMINKNKYRKYYIFFVGFILVYVEILSGVRSEAIGLAVALIAYKFDLDEINLKVFKKKIKSQKNMYFLFIILVVIVFLIGKTRTGGEVTFSNFAAFEAISSTFLSAVYLIDSNYMDFLYGKTYLDIIPQTLPQSLYPGRPMVPAQIILETPYSASGGAFIVGTAYMNFWLIGPFIIMYFFGRILQVVGNGLQSWHALKHVIYLSFVMSFFRLMYYSELSTYKMLIVGIFAFMMISSINAILVSSSK